jgi:site-specific DNA recombinase
VRTDLLDLAVWQEVRKLLEHPERMAEEYRRRLRPHSEARDADLAIDAYAEGLIEKGEFEPRIARLRGRITRLEEQAQRLADEAALQAELRLIVGRLEEFREKVKDGLEEADWSTRRDIIRALVKRVEVGEGEVNVVFRVDQNPFDPSPERGSSQHRRRRHDPALRRAFGGVREQLPAVHDPRL